MPARRASTSAGADRVDPASIVVERRVEWSDTDASGIHHNTFIVRLAEAAEGALWRGLGLDLTGREGRLPRVRMEIEYLRPLLAGQLIEGAIAIDEIGRTSLTYRFEARRDGEPVARVRMVVVRVSGTDMKPMKWPDDVREALLTRGELPAERFTR